MILDILQSPLGIDLAIAPTDRILGGELVVVARIGQNVLYVRQHELGVSLQPQGYDACHSGTGHRRASRAAIGEALPRHGVDVGCGAAIRGIEVAVPRRYHIDAWRADHGLCDTVEHLAIAAERTDVAQGLLWRLGILLPLRVSALGGVGTPCPYADDIGGAGPVAARNDIVAGDIALTNVWNEPEAALPQVNGSTR